MNRLNLNDYLSGLNRQISTSVAKIKGRDEAVSGANGSSEDKETEANTTSSQLGASRYTLLDSGVSYLLSDWGSLQPQRTDSVYASESYRFSRDVNKPSTVVIDLMFENNREFDFKV